MHSDPAAGSRLGSLGAVHPAAAELGGGRGHGDHAHSHDEYIVIEGNEKVAGFVRAEESYVDILYAYVNWPS